MDDKMKEAWIASIRAFDKARFDGIDDPFGAAHASLKSSGYRIVPEEATLEMLDNGHRAYMQTQRSGVSGMTIEAQTRAECAREAACWRAMIAASEEEE